MLKPRALKTDISKKLAVNEPSTASTRTTETANNAEGQKDSNLSNQDFKKFFESK